MRDNKWLNWLLVFLSRGLLSLALILVLGFSSAQASVWLCKNLYPSAGAACTAYKSTSSPHFKGVTNGVYSYDCQYYIQSTNTTNYGNPFTCSGVCPEGSTLDQSTGECKKDDDCSMWAGGDLSGSNTDGSCDCPSGQQRFSTEGSTTYFCVSACSESEVRNPATGTCDPAPDDCSTALFGDLSGSPTDGSCACPADKQQFNGQCLDPCPDGTHRNTETGACDNNCNNNQTWNSEAQRCDDACSSPLVSTESGGCSCPPLTALYTDMDGQQFCVSNQTNSGDGSATGNEGNTSGDTGSDRNDSGSGDDGSDGTDSGGSGDTGSGGGGSGSTGGGTDGTDGTDGTTGGTTGGTTDGTGTCSSGMTNPDGSCYVADGGTGNVNLTGVVNLLNQLNSKIPGTVNTGGQGSFDTSGLDAEANAEKMKLMAKIDEIKASFTNMFTASTPNGTGHLPCYRDIPLFAGLSFDMCFQDYEDELAIIPLFVYGMGFLLAGFIILGGGRKS